MFESAKEVKRSMWFSESGGNNPKSVWWNDMVKAVDREKEAAWKEVMKTTDGKTKERYMEGYKEEKRKFKRCIYQTQKKVMNNLEEDE